MNLTKRIKTLVSQFLHAHFPGWVKRILWHEGYVTLELNKRQTLNKHLSITKDHNTFQTVCWISNLLNSMFNIRLMEVVFTAYKYPQTLYFVDKNWLVNDQSFFINLKHDVKETK